MALMQIEYGSEQYHQMVKLRDEVLRKPLGLTFSPEHLERDINDVLICAFDDGRMMGCCILTEIDSQTMKLRQMAVANKQQHKGIGYAIMQFAENLARDKGCKKITMHARDTALGFYQKLGYKIVGEQFVEVSVPHHVMEKMLR
ncbi:MAG TPA: GNAT family N-acetyltransferase [Phnomibacter sp.]|nr:GNAT family N-acetyltransferase [Phnomibacter sp.]